MMVAAAVLGYLWGEFMMTSNTLRNVTLVSNLECTPYQKWTGQTPDISKLRVLGSKSFYQIDKKERHGKFQPVAYKVVLVGYTMSNNSYRVWDPVKHTIYNVGSPAFDETAKPGWWRKSTAAAAPVADEQVIFPDLPPFPAPATIQIPDPAPDPAPAPASSDSHAASTVDTGEEEVAVLADREPEAEPAPDPDPDPPQPQPLNAATGAYLHSDLLR